MEAVALPFSDKKIEWANEETLLSSASFFVQILPATRARRRASQSLSLAMGRKASKKASADSASLKTGSTKDTLAWKKGDWMPSTVTTSELEALVANGLLPPRDLCTWSAPCADTELSPLPDTNERVVTIPFFERGLGLPAHDFLHGLLHHYGMQLHHLTPNSLLHISCFITLCEAFLGI